MTVISEGQHTGEFIVSEANGSRSREVVTLLSGSNLKAGAVLGKVAATGKYKECNPANSDGSQTAAAVLYDNVDATAADAEAVVIARDAEVNKAELQWFDGASDGQKTTGLGQLALVGIIGR
jgi:hypothetical protein